MTGPEHYLAAERLLRILTKPQAAHGGAVIDASMNPNVAAAAQVPRHPCPRCRYGTWERGRGDAPSPSKDKTCMVDTRRPNAGSRSNGMNATHHAKAGPPSRFAALLRHDDARPPRPFISLGLPGVEIPERRLPEAPPRHDPRDGGRDGHPALLPAQQVGRAGHRFHGPRPRAGHLRPRRPPRRRA